jgi:hypothetical protein
MTGHHLGNLLAQLVGSHDGVPSPRDSLSLAWLFLILAWGRLRGVGWMMAALWAAAIWYVSCPLGWRPPRHWNGIVLAFLVPALAAAVDVGWVRVRQRLKP